MRILPLSLPAFLALCGVLTAQSFNFANFSSVANLALNGSAAQAGSALQITPAVNNSAGSVWYTQPQPITGGFDTTFTFRVTAPGTAADGFTFAIQNAPQGTTALGLPGGALGYGGLTTLANSLVVEFDSFANGDFGETLGNRISVHTNGAGINSPMEAFSIGETGAGIVFANGLANLARIEYTPGTLNVYLNNLGVPLLSVNYDLDIGGTLLAGIPVGGLDLPAGEAFVGFTGACGGLSQNALIENWSWASAAGSVFSLDITQPAGPGSVRIAVSGGIPNASYLTAISFDPANGTAPGTGYWGGLHIPLGALLAQFGFGVPPFTGVLDGQGEAVFSLPGGSLAPGFPTSYCVTRTFDPAFTVVTATTSIVVATLL